MEKIQNTRKSLPRRIAVATVAVVAVVAGVGMAPAGADDDVKAEAEAGVEAEVGSPFLFSGMDRLDIYTKGDKLSAEVSGETESHVGDQSYTVQITMDKSGRYF